MKLTPYQKGQRRKATRLRHARLVSRPVGFAILAEIDARKRATK